MAPGTADLLEPWRKHFNCKPVGAGDRAEARRFQLEFPEAMDDIDAGGGYTLGDVARGTH